MPSRPHPRLLLIGTAPVSENGHLLHLDVKFVEGMRLHRDMWPGSLTCILRRGDVANPFGAHYAREDLGFDLQLIDCDAEIDEAALSDYDLVFCPADAHDTLHIAVLGRRIGVKVVYSIEYVLKTRLQIVGLGRDAGLPRRLFSMAWLVRQELRRRRAFRLADAVQANGYPAAAAYGRLNAKTMMYLDNRMRPDMFATPDEMHAKAAALRSGAPLRLVHSGRLEPMKGAQDLIPVARGLRARGVDFTLDIFGAGSLRDRIARDIEADGLTQVKLRTPVDFETELVPWGRRRADIFLSCHRQSDPSCTYLESMGCGLAVAGYRNDMWLALMAASGGGWAVPVGDADRLADLIAGLSGRRTEIVERAEAALEFARARDFVTEFARRMEHLRATAC